MAIPRLCIFFLATWLIITLGGCGDIRFSQIEPGARDFHPQALALLSLDVVGHEEARAVVDRLITDGLTDKKYYKKVLSAQAVYSLSQKDEALRTATAAYLGKLEAVNFSDSDLSRKIGGILGVDVFLLVNIDYWYYTREADKNVAKVGLSMRLINADNGFMIWKAGHDLAPDYVIIKPELNSIAADVVGQMIGAMPH